MKHSLRIIILLVLFFFLSQLIGLVIVYPNLNVSEVEVFNEETNQTINITQVVPSDNQFVESPEFARSIDFLGYIVFAIILATILFLFLIKFKTTLLWKFWFFLAVFLCLSNAFYSLMPKTDTTFFIAFSLGFLLALWKILRPGIILHNFTEVFIYGGLAAILVPIQVVSPGIVIILLLIISVYDAYSVWKSKHMVKMAQFQAKSKIFAGLMVPYKREDSGDLKMPKKTKGKLVIRGVKTAILGGGDVAFPLLFSGVVMKSLILTNSLSAVFLKSLIIPIFATIALLLLFVKGREDRFYPALPFLTAGCLIGYGVLLLINLAV